MKTKKGTHMLIDEINFSALYQQQLALAQRTEKAPEHWDKRAEKMAVILSLIHI